MRRKILFLVPATLTSLLAGCMTMGGTVKGNFACRAPDGVCAPTSSIDDRALAMIVDASGTTGDRSIAPAGPFIAPRPVTPGFQQTALDATRTGERVLRIVFPAQIDAAGRLHEQTAVHAVVDQGDWRQASAENLVATSRAQVAAATGGETLLAAVVRADPPIADDGEPDPGVPTAAAVAAARAGGGTVLHAPADPIGAIRDEVARRVTPTPSRISYSSPKATAPAATPRATAAAPARIAPVSLPSAATTSADTYRGATYTTPHHTPSAPLPRSTMPSATGIVVPAHATAGGRAAIAAVTANSAVTAQLARGAPEARMAAKGNEALPVVHAASLPGVEP